MPSPDKISIRNRDIPAVQRGLKVLSSGVTDAGGLRKFDFPKDTYWDIVRNSVAAEKQREVFEKGENGLLEKHELTAGDKVTAENREKALAYVREKNDLGDALTEEVFIPLNVQKLQEKNQKFQVPADTMADLWPILDQETIT